MISIPWLRVTTGRLNMKTDRLLFLILFYLLTGFTSESFSQEVRTQPGAGKVVSPDSAENLSPESSPQIILTQTGDKKKEAHGYVRAWCGRAIKGRQYAVALAPPGSSKNALKSPDSEIADLIWLVRRVGSGNFSDYFEIPVGEYEVFVIEEKAEGITKSNADFKSPTGADILSKKITPLVINKNSQTTLIIFDNNDDLQLLVEEDSAKKYTGKQLRIFNFTDDKESSVDQILKGAKEPNQSSRIWSAADGSGKTIALNNVNKSAAFQATLKGVTGRLTKRYLEADFADTASCSLIIFKDRYDRLTAKIIKNSP